MTQEQTRTDVKNLEYKIAFVNPYRRDYGLSDWLNTNPERKASYDVRTFSNAIPALRELTTEKYDLIILELKLAPGLVKDHGLGEFDNDPRIEEIMAKGSDPSHPDYWKLGLYVIEKTRSQGPNKKTPIFVFSVYNPETDLDFFEGEYIDDLALRAGADEFYSFTMIRMEDFVNNVVKQLELAKK